MGKYQYTIGKTTYKGDFSIYQAIHGGIVMAMANRFITLSHFQVTSLSINYLEIEDFNHSDFLKYYKLNKL